MSTSTALAKNRKTPGVYITEFPAFPSSIVGVATAVPIFVGYTETAVDPSSGQQMYGQPIEIASLADYVNTFGQGYQASGAVVMVTVTDYDFQTTYQTVVSGANGDELKSETGYYNVGTPAGQGATKIIPQFNLYPAMQMFYANGGGNCYVVSVGNYKGDTSSLDDVHAPGVPVLIDPLLKGLDIAGTVRGPTMTVVPDACLLSTAEYGQVAQLMLKQAAELQDRVAILDLPGALDDKSWTSKGLSTYADEFYTAIAPAADAFSYGAAYAPALESSLLSVTDIDYRNLNSSDAAFSSATLINNLLTSQALALYPPVGLDYSKKFIDIAARIAAAYPLPSSVTSSAYGTPTGVTGYVDGPKTSQKLLVSLITTGVPTPDPKQIKEVQALDQYLVNALPLTSKIEQILADQLNVVPPSGAIAGIWSLNDVTRGVWHAPANLSLARIVAPKVDLNDAEQGELNVPLNGNAIDVLRTKPLLGTVVWGARTLDGNSPDYRYIQVRRTLNYIEQSIKVAMQSSVFESNTGQTWAKVTGSVSTFLTQLWQAGGLMGDKPGDAFTVNCGVPTTMSGLDVLNGYMIVNVTVSLIRPAEFIELTFKQTMQGV